MLRISIDDILRKTQHLRATRQDDEAIALLTDAITSCPDARLYCARAIQFDLTSQPERAIEDLTTALTLDPNNADVLVHRGCIRSHSFEQDREAVVDFEQALDLDPNNIEAHRECCLCLLILGRPEHAWSHALAALRLAPCDAVTYFCIGEAQMSLSQFADAVKSFAQAVKLDPEPTHYWAALNRAIEKKEQNEDG